jgi:hypothetical protein
VVEHDTDDEVSHVGEQQLVVVANLIINNSMVCKLPHREGRGNGRPHCSSVGETYSSMESMKCIKRVANKGNRMFSSEHVQIIYLEQSSTNLSKIS